MEGNDLFNDALNTFHFLVIWCLLYVVFHRQDSTYHCFCYTSCGALAGIRNSSMGPRGGINLTTHCTMSGCFTTELYPAALFLSEKETWKNWLMLDLVPMTGMHYNSLL